VKAVSLYDKKLVSNTLKEAKRSSDYWGTQTIPCSSSSQAHHMSHHPIKGPSPDTQRT